MDIITERIIPAQIPSITEGWGASFTNTSVIKSFFYNLANKLLYAILYNQQFNVYVNVPKSTAKQFISAENPDIFYVNSVDGFYSPCLLTNGCVPLKTNDGKFLVIR